MSEDNYFAIFKKVNKGMFRDEPKQTNIDLRLMYWDKYVLCLFLGYFWTPFHNFENNFENFETSAFQRRRVLVSTEDNISGKFLKLKNALKPYFL